MVNETPPAPQTTDMVAGPPAAPDAVMRRGWLSPFADLMVKIFAIAVPVSYFLGRDFVNSFWTRMQLPSGIGAYEFHDYVYFGFSSLFVPLLELVANGGRGPIEAAAVAAAAIVVTAFICLVIGRLIESPMTRWGKKLEKLVHKAPKHKITRDLLHAFAAGVAFLGAVMALMATVLCMVFPLMVAEHSGERRADQLRHQMEEHPEAFAQATWLDGGQLKTGRVAMCTEQWCVLFVDEVFVAHSREVTRLLTGGREQVPASAAPTTR